MSPSERVLAPPPRWRRAVTATVASTVLAALVLPGCGPGRSDEARVKAEIAKQLALTPPQADCLWHYLTRELDRKTIDQIPTRGLTVIPSAHWGAYVEGTLTCVLYGSLVGDGRVPGAGG